MSNSGEPGIDLKRKLEKTGDAKIVFANWAKNQIERRYRIMMKRTKRFAPKTGNTAHSGVTSVFLVSQSRFPAFSPHRILKQSRQTSHSNTKKQQAQQVELVDRTIGKVCRWTMCLQGLPCLEQEHL